MDEQEAKGLNMQAADVPALGGDPKVLRALVEDAFTTEWLARVEKKDPGRTEHYMAMVEAIFSIAYAMTQPDSDVALVIKGDAFPLDPMELVVILKGMEAYEMITIDDKHGIRISKQALAMVQPMPKERLDS